MAQEQGPTRTSLKNGENSVIPSDSLHEKSCFIYDHASVFGQGVQPNVYCSQEPEIDS